MSVLMISFYPLSFLTNSITPDLRT